MGKIEQSNALAKYEEIYTLNSKIKSCEIDLIPKSLAESYSAALDIRFSRLQEIPIDSFQINRQCLKGKESKVAVVVHFFYQEIWPSIERRLKTIPPGVGLFITCPAEKLELASRLIYKNFPYARIIASKNLGMDIFPFLSIVPILANEGYEIVFKLQTKKGQNQLGELWRDVMLDSLIGDGDNFLRIADSMLSDKTIAISGPGSFYLSAGRQMMNNLDHLKAIVDILKIDEKILDSEWGFFAGSMFCARVNALLALTNHFNLNSNIELNEYKLDGNIEHALERFFGLLPQITGGKIGLMYPSIFGFLDSSLVKVSKDDGISYAPNISYVLTIISKLDHSVRSLSAIFDLDYYSSRQPLIHKSKVCKIRHYLLYGFFKDISPCEQFDIDRFWKEFYYHNTGKYFTLTNDSISDAMVQYSLNCHKFNNNLDLFSTQNTSEKFSTVIANSGVFDKYYYEKQVGKRFSKLRDAINHYLEKGVYRGYSPIEGFIPKKYHGLNKDVLMSVVEPLSHYCKNGAIEGRNYQETPTIERNGAPYFRYLVLNGTLIDWNSLKRKQWLSDSVSIVIPVFNNIQMTKDCIHSIYSHKSTLRFEIICVDNGSQHDQSQELERFCAQFENLVFIRNKDNYNFALGCNIGFSHSSSQAVIFLNNDTLVEDFWLDKLYTHLYSDENIVAVQPRLLYEDRSIQCVGVVFADKQVIGYPIYQGIQPNDPLYLANHDKFQAITAACIAIRSVDFARVGGFDCHYINGQEDIDLCLRLCDESNKYCSVAHNCEVIHLESKTPNRGKYIKQNRQFFASRWRNLLQSDDKLYYSQDNLCISGWIRDSADFRRLNIAAHRPILRQRKIQDPQYVWSREHEPALISNLVQYEQNHENKIAALKVSIIMPTKNRSDIIKNAIDSVLCQSHQNLELLVIDDGSDDNSTKHIIDSISDPRIKYFKTRPLGVASARNTGLDAATGDYIAFLDSDNTWNHQFLRYSLLHLLSTDSEACFSGLQAVNDDQEVIYYRCNDYDKIALFEGNYIDLNTIMHHHSINSRNDLELRRLVDWDYILNVAAQVNFSSLKLVLTNYYDGTGYKRITKNVAQKREEILGLLDYVRSKPRATTFSEGQFQNQPHAGRIPAKILNQGGFNDQKLPTIRIKSPCPNAKEQPFWGDHHFAVALVKAFKKIGINNCFIDNLDSWYSTPPGEYDVVIVLRGLSKYKPYSNHTNILWIISHPEKISASEMQQYDRIYCASIKYSAKLNSQHALNVIPLLQATDPDLFFPRDLKEYSSSTLLFVGNSRNIYRESVKYLFENNFNGLKVIGRDWEQFIDSSCIAMQNIPNTQLCSEYQSAHFVFNDHWDTMRQHGFISNRIFDVVASGAKLITDYVEGLDSIIPVNVIFAYNQTDEIKDYLNSPHSWPKASDLSHAASLIRRDHTFLARANTILAYIMSRARVD